MTQGDTCQESVAVMENAYGNQNWGGGIPCGKERVGTSVIPERNL